MLASRPLDTGDSGEKAFNLLADYSERSNLEEKIDNKNFVSGVFGKITQRFQRNFEKIFFWREISQGNCHRRWHFRCRAKLRLFRAKKAFKKSGGRNGQKAFNDLKYII